MGEFKMLAQITTIAMASICTVLCFVEVSYHAYSLAVMSGVLAVANVFAFRAVNHS